MSTFDERLEMTNMIEENMADIFDDDNTIVQEFGCMSLVGQNEDLFNYLKEPEVNQKASAMIVKFAPDFMLLKNSMPRELYFVDIKHSISPIWSTKRMEMLRGKNNDNELTCSKVGVVAREALLSYRRFYPNTIILMACPYNEKLLMAQFADKVKCLYCYHGSNRGDYDCENCPSKNGGYFDLERATDSLGSQTPMTNVDLDSFLPIEKFFNELKIPINTDKIEELKERIKQENIQIEYSGKNESYVKNRVKWSLNQSGCNWVEYELYTVLDNNFYHINKNCSCIKNMAARLEAYSSRLQGVNSVNKQPCKWCCQK